MFNDDGDDRDDAACFDGVTSRSNASRAVAKVVAVSSLLKARVSTRDTASFNEPSSGQWRRWRNRQPASSMVRGGALL